MPLFNYRCSECGVLVELLLLPGDQVDGKKCPACQSEMKREVGRPNFKVKGFHAGNGYGLRGHGDITLERK